VAYPQAGLGRLAERQPEERVARLPLELERSVFGGVALGPRGEPQTQTDRSGRNVALRTRGGGGADTPVKVAQSGWGQERGRNCQLPTANCQLFSAGTLPAKGGATMRNLGIWLVLGGIVACSKSEPAGGSAPASSNQPPSVVSSQPAAAAVAPASAAAATAPTPAPTPSGAPASFKGGTKETIGAAVGLGCEATSLDGWLQLLCRKKNGTGGHPVRAVMHGQEAAAAPAAQEPGSDAPSPDSADAPNTDELTPNEQGELTIVVPFSGEERRDVNIEWTDTSYTLHVTGPKATLEWAASGIPHRRACQQVLDETKAVLGAAQKQEGEARLTTTEASKLPRFGVCQPGGLGSWALALKTATGKGEGAARQLHLELEVVRVDVEGARKSASFGSIDAAPSGFELASLQVYDYDDDGKDELIVPYELKATGGATPTYPPAIWSFSDAGVAAYAKAPQVSGGIGIEQLDFDMRPDFGSYAGFVAYLGADCGLKTCPGRVTGPKLYLHSTPDGSFTDRDDATKSALKRAACQSKPATVVVEAAGSVNAVQTAKNLVCARAYGVTPEAISAELVNKHAALCGEAATCPLQSAFEAWLKAPLPIELSQASAAVTKK
jgi:hypothetical protein